MRWWDEECGEELFDSDPLLVERNRPVTDEEADRFEEICRAATPGPLVVDDRSEGGGAVIAYLPDGRSVVSESDPLVDESDVSAAAEANATLICRARCMILRLLRDRRLWQRREQELLERVRAVEAEIERHQQAVVSAGQDRGGRRPPRPR